MQYMAEAVFANGRRSMVPIEKQFQVCKDELEGMISADEEFDPGAYWRKQCWKDLEDKITKVFGFRSVDVNPWNEKYDRKSGNFETKELSVEVSYYRRYPIDGLVTENGFYDKSHSLTFTVLISLGTIRALTAAELTACMLHEFGHIVDPALMDIHYAETNALAKYMTDRETSMSEGEKKALKGKKGLGAIATALLYTVAVIAQISILALAYRIGQALGRKLWKKKSEEDTKKGIQQIQTKLKKEAEVNRRTNEEAYADDFARMYGYGPQLASALMKIYGHNDTQMRSRLEREQDRQKAIVNLFLAVLDDTHKTDVQRIKALIKEYHRDINDPNTPPGVKKQLQEDVGELEKVLNEYLNNFDELTNRINRMIAEAVDAGGNENISEETEVALTDPVSTEYINEASAVEIPPSDSAHYAGFTGDIHNPMSIPYDEDDDYGDMNNMFIEAAKHPVRQKIQDFKNRYHYKEEMVDSKKTGGQVLGGVIEINGQKLILVDDDHEPVTLRDLNKIGKSSDFITKYDTPPRIHLSLDTLTVASTKERHATIMHEFRHFLQRQDEDGSGPVADAKARYQGVNLDDIHGTGIKEVDADIYAAQHSKDKDANMKGLRRTYRNAAKKSVQKREMDWIAPTLSKADRATLEKMVEESLVKTRSAYMKQASNGDKEATANLKKPMDLKNPILEKAIEDIMSQITEKFPNINEVDHVLRNLSQFREKMQAKERERKMRIQKIIDEEIAAYRKKLEYQAHAGIGSAKEMLEEPLSSTSDFMTNVLYIVADRYEKETGEFISPTVMLWYTDKYRSLLYREGKKDYDPRHNTDYQERLKAHQQAKAKGMTNPYGVRKGKTLTIDEIITLYQQEITGMLRETIDDNSDDEAVQHEKAAIDQVFPSMRRILKDLLNTPIREDHFNEDDAIHDYIRNLARELHRYLVYPNRLKEVNDRIKETKQTIDTKRAKGRNTSLDELRLDRIQKQYLPNIQANMDHNKSMITSLVRRIKDYIQEDKEFEA